MKILLILTLVFLLTASFKLFKIRKDNITAWREAGEMLFENHKAEFKAFFDLYQTDKNKFMKDNAGLIENYIMEGEAIQPFDVIKMFGNDKDEFSTIDWRGEEDEGTIRVFIEKRLGKKLPWTNTNKFIANNSKKDRRDGVYIIDMFGKIDHDLQADNKRLIFIEQDGDSYIYTTTTTAYFNAITGKLPNAFYGMEKLKK